MFLASYLLAAAAASTLMQWLVADRYGVADTNSRRHSAIPAYVHRQCLATVAETVTKAFCP